MHAEQQPEQSSLGSPGALLAVVFAVTVTLLTLTEHFRELAGSLAAFAAAAYIVRL